MPCIILFQFYDNIISDTVLTRLNAAKRSDFNYLNLSLKRVVGVSIFETYPNWDQPELIKLMLSDVGCGWIKPEESRSRSTGINSETTLPISKSV